MKKVYIIALHLAYGGVEKAIISMANLFADRYEVEIISVYDMPQAPAFPLDGRVSVRYLLDETPNKEAWRAAVRSLSPVAAARESIKALRILRGKKAAVRQAIEEIDDGIIITTRHEDNMALSKYGRDGVYKIAQLHHDHRFQRRYVDGMRSSYGNIDVLAMLSPGLADEARGFLPDGAKTKVMYIPNFLEHYPQSVDMGAKEKTVITAGRLDPVKGFDRLIRSFYLVHSVHPDWTLKIFGEGTERALLEETARELGLEGCVRLPGRLDSAALEDEMLRASIFAMSSKSEGFPFVIIEAQSCWLPAVAYDVRVGPQFMIKDGEDGYLVPDGDEALYAQRINDLIENRETREKLAAAARESSQEFSREQVARLWFSVLGDQKWKRL